MTGSDLPRPYVPIKTVRIESPRKLSKTFIEDGICAAFHIGHYNSVIQERLILLAQFTG